MKKFYYTVINSKIGFFGRLLLVILILSSILIISNLFSANFVESIESIFLLVLPIIFYLIIIWAFISFFINFAYWTITNKSIFSMVLDLPLKFFYFIIKLFFGDWENTILLKEKDNGKK